MDSEIDFSTYTLDELYSSARAIDREAYPDRAKEIDDLIKTREAQNPSENIVSKVAGEKATRSDRLVAAIVDGVLGVVCFIPVFILVGFDNLSQPTLTLSAGLLGYGILSTLVLHGYLMYQRGQTIGKSLMSIRIENLDGTQASFTTIYFKRMLCMQLLSLVPSVGQFIAGFVNPLFIFGKDKRCLHDHLAGTKVSYVD
ncbi:MULTISPECIES: RDD family protein [unclassified Pseudoalteromonas]|uniref:RDD family protein n=1 Tax=unclassified Pseudoalteromonas TaxID=194690 RepID=UPI0015FF0E91|nr:MULTISPECIES: RDD family protein [unclassified Pseudoalteromonas]MBB1325083.1 RDD family protein [Pseudoalteromonas sp. SR45-1]MBB1431307.1 RDD family protein [Pseudoalteromonas sp. SG43-4]